MRDIDIRSVLLQSFDEKYGDDPETLVVQELGLCQGQARVDLAIINGSLHGIEIKSDRDTLSRLSAQQAIYNKVFDQVTLVAGTQHLSKAKGNIPSWWGLSEALYDNGQLVIHEVIPCHENPCVDAISIAQLLWRDETLVALTELGLDKGFRSKTRSVLCERLVEAVPVNKLQQMVRKTIRDRSGWRVS